MAATPEKVKDAMRQRKVHTVMKEFKKKTLRSGSGQLVKKKKQALAIALSEAGLSRKK